MQPTNELYYKYAGVIDSVVKKYAIACPSLADDLFLQAQYEFCKACLTYDENHASNASFETWLRRRLQTITNLITKMTHSPMYVPDADADPVMDDEVTSHFGNGTSKGLSYLASDYFVPEYGDSLENYHDSMYHKDLDIYVKALKGDALQIYNDFCLGLLDSKPQMNRKLELQRKDAILNPDKLYRRCYMDEGWSIERVRKAWHTLQSVFRCYKAGKLPSVLAHMESNSQDGGSFKDAFEQNHGISYNLYRRLRSKGLVPAIGKNKNMDLSQYAVLPQP